MPATTEIVIEGHVLPGERVREGPFGEFTGYYGAAELNPVMEVTAITHRREPIFLAGLTGVPTTDNHILKGFAYESVLLENLRKIFPEVTRSAFPDWGGVAVRRGRRAPAALQGPGAAPDPDRAGRRGAPEVGDRGR